MVRAVCARVHSLLVPVSPIEGQLKHCMVDHGSVLSDLRGEELRLDLILHKSSDYTKRVRRL